MAQSNYFIQYAYNSQRDSVKNKRVVSEMVNLYTSPTKTLYVANNRLVTDSLYQEIDQEKEMAAIMESKVLNVADLKKNTQVLALTIMCGIRSMNLPLNFP